MPAWKLRGDGSVRVYERALGLTELGFYWDSKFNGTADTLQHALVEILDPLNQKTFGADNITLAWQALKQQFPLLGAYLEEQRDGEQISFVVAEDRLQSCGPGEAAFHTVDSLTAAQEFADAVINGERLLSDNLLARIVILFRTDAISHIHLLIHVAHCITDGMANATTLRSFLDILSAPAKGTKWDLEERLALALPSTDLVPGAKLNTARYRWHRAVGQILSAIRMSKITGGHTLPRKYSHLTPYTPARSGNVACSFSPEQSVRIIQNCRANGLTFGNAYPVLAQVALTRVLCRRYIRGDIDREEWEYRKKEPMVTGGPLSIRPYLDREWHQNGGSGNVALAIGFFFMRLPFMPLGSAGNLRPGDSLPSFQDLLSFQRFLLRSRSIKRQSASLMKHPLFLHLSGTRSQASVERLKDVARNWKKKRGEAAVQIPVMKQSPVMAHGGSSLGNIDHLVPRYYPLEPRAASTPRLYLHFSQTRLHCRPAELYLGAATTRQQLHLNVFWDMNVYEEDTIREWLNEVREATEFYLGGEGSIATGKPLAHL
ncbi:hypothetical protein LshimejAT787_0204500 [Lyophyllum shimeji]|uniref:Condensation domain-containing protein n=1 Tax=Lyophyllum shimeji TaxID=47721 RepID=A0A9P3UKU4_LYOSH|nr:hypothetical protein LshimejAT787_0204500 [Lyophyllum shimeji]